MMHTQILHSTPTLPQPLNVTQHAQLQRYLDLLEKWNSVINLTAVRERTAMESLHVQDSLSVLPYLENCSTLLDVGSGAGLPGIPLAVACPHMAVTLLEANQKKAAFLRQAKLELNLSNVTVVAERVEQWQNTAGFDAIVSRAFSDLPDFVAGARHLRAKGGMLIAMKGVVPFEEITRLSAELTAQVVPVVVPGLDAERHLILISEKQS
jgi:16S rRNA (guanine527-N7)-methyltransferase